MRFNLIDRIVELQPGRSLWAYKNLTLGEEYLADHFPTFPVMPGVLMLHTLVEAGAWLLRLSDDYRYSVVTLREAAVRAQCRRDASRMNIALALYRAAKGKSAERLEDLVPTYLSEVPGLQRCADALACVAGRTH